MFQYASIGLNNNGFKTKSFAPKMTKVTRSTSIVFNPINYLTFGVSLLLQQSAQIELVGE